VLDQHFTVFKSVQKPSKAFPAVDRFTEFDLRFEPLPALKVLGPRQRPVDAGRGDFEIVLA
jgi:hypothetical protein